MGSEWKKHRLEDITELIVDCPHSTPLWTDEGVLVLRNQNIRNGKLDLANPSFTNEEGYLNRVKRAIPQNGDLVLTREAPMGEVCQIPKNLKCCLGQRMVLIRANTELVDPNFLLYEMQSPNLKHQIAWNEGTGTTVSNIRIPNIKGFQVNLPPLKEQKALAHILGTLDDKIELNRQMNQTLEAMAQALFKSWFVDFDPVIDNALAAGNTIPDALQAKAKQRLALGDKRKALPEAVQQLFPAEFEFSEALGTFVPVGWEVKALKDFINVKHGFAFKGANFSTEPTNDILLTPGNFKIGGGFKGVKFKYYNADYPESYILAKNDLIITMTDLSKEADTLGFPALVPESKEYRYLHNQRLGKVEFLNDELSTFFLYYTLCSNQYRAEIVGGASGTTVKHTSPSKILSHEFLVAPKYLNDLFERKVKNLKEKDQKNELEIITLTKLRDTLLPKLISGEVRV